MYVSPNFSTKKKLKEAVLRYNDDVKKLAAASDANASYDVIKALGDSAVKGKVTVFSPGFGQPPRNGSCCVEGPHFLKTHTWYAEVEIKDGIVVKVR